MDLFMQDTPKVTSEVTLQSRSVEYYLHSYLNTYTSIPQMKQLDVVVSSDGHN